MGVQQASKLFWGDPAVVRAVALGLVSDGGPSVSERGVASLPLVPIALRQRNPHPGEAGRQEVGLGPGLPRLRQEHSPSLAVAEILILLYQ